MMARIRQLLPLVVIVAAFVWASVTIFLRRQVEAPPDVKVIRIGHWQLESGVRDAFERLGREFAQRPDIRARYGEVRIVQEAIPEGIYGQWVSTQMIGGTAPDLVEIGMGLPWTTWLAYQNRYFERLTTAAHAPNPFNKGTNLERVALKDTFTDGMRSGYLEELQDYVRIPLSRFTTRVFYNADLLQKLTGRSVAPQDFREFLAVCRTIGAAVNDKGERYTPIASSRYHMGMWQMGLCDPLTYRAVFAADYNRDGYVGNDETFTAMRAGALSFDSPPVRAKFVAARQVIDQFQPGFAGLTRDEAVFLFAQQRAVFISTGTWDAGSLLEQAKGKFRVGVMNYPQPAADDPEFGGVVCGPNYDPAGFAFPFGVTRFSRHPELARDFLLFLASQEGNASLNQTIGWIPTVREAPLPPLLKDFAPVNHGMYACVNLELGGQTVVRFQQLYSLLQTDSTYTYERFAREFGAYYLSQGLADWEEQQRDWRRVIRDNERLLASLRGEALASGSGPADPPWIRYRAYTAARQVFPEIAHAEQQRRVGAAGRQSPAYTYSAAAIERIRKNLSKDLSKDLGQRHDQATTREASR